MGILLKIAIFIVVVAVTAGFVINKIPDLRQKFVEYINPAAKERRLLGEMDNTLKELEDTTGKIAGAKSSEEMGEHLNKAKDLISQAKNLRSEIEETNDKDGGLLRSNLTKIIDSMTDGTPYPADHMKIPDEVKKAICAESL